MRPAFDIAGLFTQETTLMSVFAIMLDNDDLSFNINRFRHVLSYLFLLNHYFVIHQPVFAS